jgi:spore coat polysaccharide biosynthesis protein SpsF (cytidylyltransferase family)
VTAPRCVAIVQARVGSSRLPGKALLDIAGRPMIAHVLDRALDIAGVDAAVLATTVAPADDALMDFARRRDIPCTRGSEDDVLDRFHQAVSEHPADVIVRVTADCPLLDPRVSGLVLGEYLRRAGDVDYVSNVHPPTYPDGLDTEVLSREALERVWRDADRPSEREHVTSYIWRNAAAFRVANVATEPSRAHLRWTVDELADLEFVRAVYARLYRGSIFGMEAVLELLAVEPDLIRINAGIDRNEGYVRSLRADDRVTVNPRRR